MKDAYVDRDTCPLPDLVSGEQVLPIGASFCCDHYCWTVQHIRAWGYADVQPSWLCSDPVTPEKADVDGGLKLPELTALAAPDDGLRATDRRAE